MKQEFVTLISKYYSNREVGKQKGLMARKRVEEVYTWDRAMMFIDSVYERAVL